MWVFSGLNCKKDSAIPKLIAVKLDETTETDILIVILTNKSEYQLVPIQIKTGAMQNAMRQCAKDELYLRQLISKVMESDTDFKTIIRPAIFLCHEDSTAEKPSLKDSDQSESPKIFNWYYDQYDTFKANFFTWLSHLATEPTTCSEEDFQRLVCLITTVFSCEDIGDDETDYPTTCYKHYRVQSKKPNVWMKGIRLCPKYIHKYVVSNVTALTHLKCMNDKGNVGEFKTYSVNDMSNIALFAAKNQIINLNKELLTALLTNPKRMIVVGDSAAEHTLTLSLIIKAMSILKDIRDGNKSGHIRFVTTEEKKKEIKSKFDSIWKNDDELRANYDETMENITFQSWENLKNDIEVSKFDISKNQFYFFDEIVDCKNSDNNNNNDELKIRSDNAEALLNDLEKKIKQKQKEDQKKFEQRPCSAWIAISSQRDPDNARAYFEQKLPKTDTSAVRILKHAQFVADSSFATSPDAIETIPVNDLANIAFYAGKLISNITYEQLKILLSDEKLMVLLGDYGSGKTMMMLIKAMSVLEDIINDKIKGWIRFVSTKNSLDTYIIPAFESEFDSETLRTNVEFETWEECKLKKYMDPDEFCFIDEYGEWFKDHMSLRDKIVIGPKILNYDEPLVNYINSAGNKLNWFTVAWKHENIDLEEQSPLLEQVYDLNFWPFLENPAPDEPCNFPNIISQSHIYKLNYQLRNSHSISYFKALFDNAIEESESQTRTNFDLGSSTSGKQTSKTSHSKDHQTKSCAWQLNYPIYGARPRIRSYAQSLSPETLISFVIQEVKYWRDQINVGSILIIDSPQGELYRRYKAETMVGRNGIPLQKSLKEKLQMKFKNNFKDENVGDSERNKYSNIEGNIVWGPESSTNYESLSGLTYDVIISVLTYETAGSWLWKFSSRAKYGISLMLPEMKFLDPSSKGRLTDSNIERLFKGLNNWGRCDACRSGVTETGHENCTRNYKHDCLIRDDGEPKMSRAYFEDLQENVLKNFYY